MKTTAARVMWMAEFLQRLIKHQAIEIWVSGDTAPSINLSTSWRFAVPVENSPWVVTESKAEWAPNPVLTLWRSYGVPAWI
jgi:hypothetical protein